MFFKIGALKNFATVKHLCRSLFLLKLKKEEAPAQVFSCEHCNIFKNSSLHWTTASGSCFYQFDRTFQYWASAGFLLLNKNTMWDGFYYKDLHICVKHVLYILLVETIPIHFCWLTCRKQNLVQSKTLQQGLFALISGFWQFLFIYFFLSFFYKHFS